jgi:hypothetical protein
MSPMLVDNFTWGADCACAALLSAIKKVAENAANTPESCRFDTKYLERVIQ